MQPIFLCKKFADLSPVELYAILQLRNQVFVVEQNCVFQDADNKDQISYHLMAWHDNTLIAYARLLNVDIAFKEVSIGRVISNPDYRGTGIGKLLMQQAINQCYQLFGVQNIRIGAQLYLKKFYEDFGFVQCSEVYDEDGIDHIEMLASAMNNHA